MSTGNDAPPSGLGVSSRRHFTHVGGSEFSQRADSKQPMLFTVERGHKPESAVPLTHRRQGSSRSPSAETDVSFSSNFWAKQTQPQPVPPRSPPDHVLRPTISALSHPLEVRTAPNSTRASQKCVCVCSQSYTMVDTRATPHQPFGPDCLCGRCPILPIQRRL